MDFTRHNEEVRKVWSAYHEGRPLRVPVIAGLNPRFFLLNPELNTEGITFRQYFDSPEVMLDVQLRFQDFVRHHIPQDAEMGLPDEGWTVTVDAQNVYDAAWWGSPIHFPPGQCPDTRPIYSEERRKRELLDKGAPSPFGGFMGRLYECFEYFQERQKDLEYKGKPIGKIVFTVPIYSDGPFDLACQLRGAQNLCLDMRMDPDYVHQVMEMLTTALIERSIAWRERLGWPLKDSFFYGADDFIQLLSVEDYAQFVLPCHQRYYDTFSADGAKRLIHLCGNATRHFPTIHDKVGVMHFDTGFPVDFKALREALGDEVTIHGGPHVELLLNGSEEAVRERTRQILASGVMRGGRFILREGNNYPPKTPLRNMQVMYETAKQYGQYE